MGRQVNDGRGRLGGRQKGTANKPLAPLNDWINGVLNKNRSVIEREMQLSPWGDRSILLFSALSIAAAINDATAAINEATAAITGTVEDSANDE